MYKISITFLKYSQGFDDALQYLQRNYLISCTKCLSVHSTFGLEEDEDEGAEEAKVLDYDPECSECRSQRQVYCTYFNWKFICYRTMPIFILLSLYI
jgi:hypothetical protein